MPPKVSVIIAAYNSEKYIRQCIDSILSQTLQNFELIIVNDGSKDNTHSILEEYQAKDNRITVIEQENLGAGVARNKGLEKASGEYLSFLDADDFFEPSMLEECTSILVHEKSDIAIYSANSYNNETGETVWMPWSFKREYLPEKSPFQPIEMKQYLFNAFQNWPWNKMFRKSFIDKKHIRFQDVRRTNDMAFVCEALAKADLISVIDKPLANYRIRSEEQQQATNHLYPLAFWDAFMETKRRLEQANLYQIYEQSFLNWVLDGCLYNMRSNKIEYAAFYVACKLKFEGEKTFGFLKHDKDFYYDERLYNRYIEIIQAQTLPKVTILREMVQTRNQTINQLKKEIAALQKKHIKEIEAHEKSIKNINEEHAEEIRKYKEIQEEILNSKSFKIGSAIMYLPHKIKSLIQ